MLHQKSALGPNLLAFINSVRLIHSLAILYHRLTDQILYTCVNDFVDTKLKQVSETVNRLRKKTGRTSQEEKELEKYSDLELELRDFRDDLLRIAKFWKPNLNDGVQITAAPLWKLFQHKPWQKKLKQTWSKLEKGEYDWAHLAYSIWPERVIKASHKDRSYAIAHDLEEDLWEEIENGTDRQEQSKIQMGAFGQKSGFPNHETINERGTGCQTFGKGTLCLLFLGKIKR